MCKEEVYGTAFGGLKEGMCGYGGFSLFTCLLSREEKKVVCREG
jgi:hypothetical protein